MVSPRMPCREASCLLMSGQSPPVGAVSLSQPGHLPQAAARKPSDGPAMGSALEAPAPGCLAAQECLPVLAVNQAGWQPELGPALT